jgi:hypothetical protein
LAQSAPQMHNMYEAYYRVYQAMNVRDIDGILKVQTNQMPKDPASENIEVADGKSLQAFAGQQHDAHIASHLIMGLSPLMQANPLGSSELQKHVLQHVRLKAEEDTEAVLFTDYGSDPDKMVSDLQREAMVAIKVAEYMMELKGTQAELSGEAGGEDPVIALKAQELQQRAAKDQADIAIKEQGIQIDQARIAQNAEGNEARIESQQEIAQLRADVARERINQPSKL